MSILMPVDGLKSSKQTEAKGNGKLIGVLAREAIRWAQESLRSKDGGVRGQQKHEVTDELALADDAILTCCMYFHYKKWLTRGFSSPDILRQLRC